jgi:threonine/homoserine/homoserine lactone efflux protein
MLFVLGYVFFLSAVLPEHLNAGDPPPGAIEIILWWTCGFVSWPLLFTALILGHDPSSWVAWLLLAVTGIFWGCLVEVVTSVSAALKRHGPVKPASPVPKLR